MRIHHIPGRDLLLGCDQWTEFTTSYKGVQYLRGLVANFSSQTPTFNLRTM
jgi:hypothetical protein